MTLVSEIEIRVYDDEEEWFRSIFSNSSKEDAIRNQYEFFVQRMGGPPLYSERKGKQVLPDISVYCGAILWRPQFLRLNLFSLINFQLNLQIFLLRLESTKLTALISAIKIICDRNKPLSFQNGSLFIIFFNVYLSRACDVGNMPLVG